MWQHLKSTRFQFQHQLRNRQLESCTTKVTPSDTTERIKPPHIKQGLKIIKQK